MPSLHVKEGGRERQDRLSPWHQTSAPRRFCTQCDAVISLDKNKTLLLEPYMVAGESAGPSAVTVTLYDCVGEG